ncbi:MAG: ACT domain-containing protein [Pseudomonadota bacterium]
MLKLNLMPDQLAVCRLPPDTPLPAWLGSGWHSITRTAEELSIVCEAAHVPAAVQCEKPWRAFVVQGPLDFSEVGILASLSWALADARISLFAVSTFDTDYLLVRAGEVEAAVQALATVADVEVP